MNSDDPGRAQRLLAEALAPVLRDLQVTSGQLLRIQSEVDWLAEEHRLWPWIKQTPDPRFPCVMLRAPDGTGAGVRIDLEATAVENIVMATDVTQEWIIESRQRQAATNWPRCPYHPHNHPLKVDTMDSQAVWICPSNGMTVAAVGALTAG